jgi:hypothetical protein
MTPQEMFPTLTEMRCDCCDLTEIDEVAALCVWGWVVTFRDKRLEKAERNAAAWDEAQSQVDTALARMREERR